MSQQNAANLIRLTQPGSGQTIVVPVDQANMRMALGFMPDPNAVEKNGQNLEFTFEDGGKIVLEGYYDHFQSKTLPVMVLDGGDELPGEDFLASLREDLLTAAGPGAGAGAPGSGAGEYADDPGALINGVDRLGDLGTIYWGYGSEEVIRPDEISTRLGTPDEPAPPVIRDSDITVTTDVSGTIHAAVFEDAKPFQYLGDYTDYLGQLHFNFDLGPDTVLTGLHLAGFPIGTEIYIGDPAVLYVTIQSADQILDLTAEHIASGVYLRPPFDTDLDMINITSTIDILNESSGATATVPGPSFTVTVDAVADKPIMTGDAGFDAPDISGSVTVFENENSSQDFVDGWATDTLSKNAGGTAPEAVDVRVSVDFHTTIRFGDYTDGSETHYALVEVPSIGTWTPTVTSPSGVFLATPPTITLYFDANGNCLGDVPSDAAASSREYFQFEVPNSLLQQTGGVVDLNVTFASSDTNLTTDTQITLDTGAMAIESPNDDELLSDNDKSYTFDRETGSGAGESPNFVIDVVDSQLNVQIGWASEDNDNSQHTTGGYNPNYAGMRDPSDGRPGALPGVDPNSTSELGAPIIISISGGDASGRGTESISSIRLYFDPAAGDILVNGSALTPVQGSDGRWFVELTQANGGINASGQATGTVHFRPGIAHSDIDVALGYEVTVTSSSGASLTYGGNSVVVIDAVADLPTGVDGSFLNGTDNLVVSGEEGTRITEGEGDTLNRETGWETDQFAPGQTVTPEQTIDIRITAYFADVDGSEDHFILVQNLPAGWAVTAESLANAGLVATGRTVIGPDGETYMVFQLVDGTQSQFDGTLTIGVTTGTTAVDQQFTVKTGAMAEERVDNPLEYDMENNQAIVINDDVLTVDVDVINSGLEINVGWASESNNDAKHVGGDNANNYEFGGSQAGSTGLGDAVDGMHANLGAPIVLGLTGTAEGSAESIAEVTFTFTENRGSLFIVDANGNEVEYTLSGPAGGPFTVTLTGDQLAGGNLYYRPNGNDYSDDDVSMDYAVTVVNEAGASVIYEGNATIVIDAVADLPTNVNVNVNEGGREITVGEDGKGLIIAGETGTVIQENTPGNVPGTDGWERDTFDAGQGVKAEQSFDVTLTANFADVDGSENHYILIESLPEGFSLDPASLAAAGLKDSGQTVTQGGKTYMMLEVLPDANGDQVGEFSGSITIKVDVAASGSDQQYSIHTGAMAVEKTADPIEYDADNNEAIELTLDNTVTIDIDVVNSGLSVNVGWASESNNDAKHVGGDSANNYEFGGSQAGSTGLGDAIDNLHANLGAPIEIGLTGTAEGSAESITGVTFTFTENRGSLFIVGADGKEVEYTLSGPKGGPFTVTLTGEQLAGGNLYYRPYANDYSDDDVSMDYAVTVANDKGASVIYEGKATIVIDAVADMPTDVKGALDGGATEQVIPGTSNPEAIVEKGAENAAGPDAKTGWDTDTFTSTQTVPTGQTFNVNLSAHFDDVDGSENHYILIQELPAGWTLDAKSLADAGLRVVEGRVITDGDGNKYMVLEVLPGKDGKQISDYAGTVKIGVSNTTEGHDRVESIKTGAMAEEKVENPLEYDGQNNQAVHFNDDSLTVKLDVINSGLKVQTGWASEGNNDAKHLASDAASDQYMPEFAKGYEGLHDSTGTTGKEGAGLNLGAPIHIDLTDPKAGAEMAGSSDESITKITLTFDGPGTLVFVDADGKTQNIPLEGPNNGVWSVTLDTTNKYGDLTDMLSSKPGTGGVYFQPEGTYDDDVAMTYEVTVANDAGASATYTGGTAIVVDAVADIGIFGTGEAAPGVDYIVDGEVAPNVSGATPGAPVSINGEILFPDSADGSEYHYIVATIPAGWTIPGNPNLVSDGQVHDKFVEDISGHTFDPFNLPASDSYLVLEMPPLSAFDANNSYTSANGVTVTYAQDPKTGEITYTYSVGDTEFASVVQDANGNARFEFTLTAPDKDDTGSISISGISVEQDPGTGEYDYENNLAIVTIKDPIIVECDGVTSKMEFSFSEFEDGMPNYWTNEDGHTVVKVGSSDDTLRINAFDKINQADGKLEGVYSKEQLDFLKDFGVPITITLTDTDANGKTVPSEDIFTIILTKVPDASQGELYVNGKLITQQMINDNGGSLEFTFDGAEGIAWPNGLSFKPTPDFSGKVDLGFTYTFESETSGQVVPSPDGYKGESLHVESVADLADGKINDISRTDGGQSDITGVDGEEGTGENAGWYVTDIDGETTVQVTIDLSAQFHDTDLSETGSVLIPLSLLAGGKVPEGAGWETETVLVNGVEYAQYTIGQISDANANVDNLKLNVVLNADAVKDLPDGKFPVIIRTDEKVIDGNDPANDTAMREVTTDYTVPSMDSSLEIKIGWVYEDNSPDKFSGKGQDLHAKGPDGTDYDRGSYAQYDSDGNAIASKYGAPITVDVTRGGNEELYSLQFSWSEGAGTMWLVIDGVPRELTAEAVNGVITIRVNYDQLQQGQVYFQPAQDSMSDKDLSHVLEYTAIFREWDGTPHGSGNKVIAEYTVNGKTTVAVDAVADFAKLDDKGSTAVAADPNWDGDERSATMDVTVKANFPDSDGENHYVLVEYREGWTYTTMDGKELTEADHFEVHYDAQGNMLQPIGVKDGKFVFDDLKIDHTKVFVRVPVADGEDGATIKVTPKPGGDGKYSDETLEVGSLVQEKAGLDSSYTEGGKEYDYSNNQAIDLGEVTLNYLDSIASMDGKVAYEDHKDKAGQQQTALKDDGVMTIKIGHDTTDDGVTNVDKSGGEYLDTNGNVVMTFHFDGPALAADGSNFIVNGTNLGTVNGVTLVNDGKGNYTLTFPASSAGTGKMESFDIRYDPPANDDHNLMGIEVKVPVTNDGNFKGTLETGMKELVVDAVADYTEVAGTKTVIDAKGAEDAGYAKATYGSEVTITVTGTFGDYLDGSGHLENHYILLRVDNFPAGWTFAEGHQPSTVTIGTVTYYYVQVSNADIAAAPAGQASVSFKLVAPSEADYKALGIDVSNDANLTAKFTTGTLALEGDIVDGKPNYDRYTQPGADSDHRTGNNLYLNESKTKVTVEMNVIQDGKADPTSTHEDGDSAQHLAGAAVASTGTVTITLDATDHIRNAADVGEGKGNTAVVTMQFKYAGGDDPGTFTYTDSKGGVHTYTWDANAKGDAIGVISGPDGNGYYTLNIPASHVTGASNEMKLTYTPPANNSDADVTNITFEVAANANNSKAEGTVTITSKDIVVDALADRPVVDREGENKPGADYDGKDYSHANQKVTITTNATFGDVGDGSESHYLLIEAKGFMSKPEGATEIWIARDSKGNLLTPHTNNGDLTTKGGTWYDPVTGKAVTPDSNMWVKFYQFDADTAINAFNDPKAEVPEGWTVVKNGDGTYSVTLEQDISVSSNRDVKADILTGGMAREEGPFSGGETHEHNNTAYDLVTVKDVGVAAVESTLTMKVNEGFENDTKWANIACKVHENALGEDGKLHVDDDGYLIDKNGNHVKLDGTAGKQIVDLDNVTLTENGFLVNNTGQLVGYDGKVIVNQFEDYPGPYDFKEGGIPVTIIRGVESGAKFDATSESITSITFTFDAVKVPDGNGGYVYESPGTMSYGNLAPVSVEIVNGKVIVTFDMSKVNGTSSDATSESYEFTFTPNPVHSHVDVNIKYEATVTDHQSGATKDYKPAGETEKGDGVAGVDPETNGTVVIDSVAQRPEFVDHAQVANGYENLKPGVTGSLEMTMHFADIAHPADTAQGADASQSHYVLVQAVTGFQPVAIHINVPGYGTVTIPSTEFPNANLMEFRQPYDGDLFFKIDISAVLDKYFKGATGDVEIKVDINVPADAENGTTIRVGAMAVENAGVVNPHGDPETERVVENNTAFRVSDEIPLNFSKAGGFSMNDKVTVYENDTKWANYAHKPHASVVDGDTGQLRVDGEGYLINANNERVNLDGSLGNFKPGGMVLSNSGFLTNGQGVLVDYDNNIITDTRGNQCLANQNGVKISYSMEADDTVEFTIKNLDDILDRGALFYNDGKGNEIPVTDATLTLNSGGYFVFVPHGGRYDDTDIDLVYTAKVTDKGSGDSYTTSEKSTEIVFDAVAQRPEEVSDDTGGKLVFGDNDPGDDASGYVTNDIKVTVNFGTLFDPEGKNPQGLFYDKDGTEKHYALIQAMANMQVGHMEDGTFVAYEIYTYKGVDYYMVPVDPAELAKGNGTVTVDATIRMVDNNDLFYAMDKAGASDSMVVGALVVDETNGKDGETVIENNVAFLPGNSVDIDYDHGHGTGGIFCIHVEGVYENDTPDAHIEDHDKQTSAGGGKIELHVGDSDATHVIFTSADGGFIRIPGAGPGGSDLVYDLSQGPVQINSEHFGNVYFVPPFNYSDKDIPLNAGLYKGDTLLGSDSFTVIVDAVAQKPIEMEDLDKAVQYGPGLEAVGPEAKEVTMTIKGTFGGDADGSEKHYALLEVMTEYTITKINGEVVDPTTFKQVIGPDGVTYYCIDMEGKASIDVTVEAKFNPTESYQEIPIRTGLLAEELNTGIGHDKDFKEDHGFELDRENNLAWLTGEEVTVVYSREDSEISVKVEGTFEGDHIPDSGKYSDQNGEFNFAMKVDQHDEVTAFEVKIDLSNGHLESGSHGDMDALKKAGFLTVDPDTNIATLNVQAMLEAAINAAKQAQGTNFDYATTATKFFNDLQLRYVAEGHSDGDVNVWWSATVKDTLSGDQATHGTGLDTSKDSSVKITVDAIADDVAVSKYETTGTNGTFEGVGKGGMLSAEFELTFEDASGSEQHFAVIAQHADWPCAGAYYYDADGVKQYVKVITVVDSNGKPFHAIEVDSTWLKNGNIRVGFDLEAPKGSSDYDTKVAYGGITSERNMGEGADKELDITNNWNDSNIKSGNDGIPLRMGVLDSTKVEMEVKYPSGNSIDENQGGSGQPFVELVFTANGNNESVTQVTINGLNGGVIVDTFGNPVTGLTYTNGGNSVTLTQAQIEAGVYFRPAEYQGDDVNLSFTAVVTDQYSGDTQEFKASSQKGSVNVDPVHTDPIAQPGVGPDGPEGTYTAYGPGENNTFTVKVNVRFPDTDGSEDQYVLVQQLPGTSCAAAEKDLVKIGDDWFFKIKVDPKTDYINDPQNPGKVSMDVEITITDDWSGVDKTYQIKVGGLASEKGVDGYEYDLADDSVTVDIYSVQSTGNSVSVAPTPGQGGAQEDVPIQLVPTDNSVAGETVTGISFTLPKGAAIVMMGLGGTYVEVPQSDWNAADFLSGKYYYQVPKNVSGTGQSVTYTVTVSDTASGASSSWTSTVNLPEIRGMTDIPLSMTGTAGKTGYTSEGNTLHQANGVFNVKATFDDISGTEEHFIIVKLPDGMHATGTGWGSPLAATSEYLLGAGYTAADAGSVYMIKITNSKQASYDTNLNVKIDPDYDGTAIAIKAGARDTHDGFAWKDGTGVSFKPENLIFNEKPSADLSDESMTNVDLYRNTEWKVGGTVEMSDDEKDAVSIIRVEGGTPDNGASTDTHLVVKGQYGTLTIEKATGVYSYELHKDGSYEKGAADSFKVVFEDMPGAGIAAKTGELSLSFTLSEGNTPPEATVVIDKPLGTDATETGYDVATGTITLSDLDDGDTVEFVSVSIGNKTAMVENGKIVIEGEHGTLTITVNPNGNDHEYSYKLNAGSERVTAVEEFTITYKDNFGEMGTAASLKINVQPVNHLPEAGTVTDKYDGSTTLLWGKLSDAYSDPDGDALRVAGIQFGSQKAEFKAGDVSVELRGEYGSLTVYANGEYEYRGDPGAQDRNTFENFSYTVADPGGLTATGSIVIQLGTPELGRMASFGAPFDTGADSLGVENVTEDDFDQTDTDTVDEPFSLGALTIGYEPGGDDDTAASSATGGTSLDDDASTDGVSTGDMPTDGGDDDGASVMVLATTGDDAMPGASETEDLLSLAGTDLMGAGGDTILDFSLGEDKLFFEQLFGGTDPADMQTALADKIDAGLLDISVNADGSQVQVTMEGQVVDIHLTENLGSTVVESIANDDSSAKAALIEMMITQVTG